MSGRALATLFGCLAFAQAGCGHETAGATAGTCGQLRESVAALRDQATVLVDRSGLRADRLSREEAILDAEFRILRACEGAGDSDRPYSRAAGMSSDGWVSPGSAR